MTFLHLLFFNINLPLAHNNPYARGRVFWGADSVIFQLEMCFTNILSRWELVFFILFTWTLTEHTFLILRGLN